jgi:hypothetical protein
MLNKSLTDTLVSVFLRMSVKMPCHPEEADDTSADEGSKQRFFGPLGLRMTYGCSRLRMTRDVRVHDDRLIGSIQVLTIAIATVFTLGLNAACAANPPAKAPSVKQEKKITRESAEIQGEISGITAESIAITYGRFGSTENEALFRLDKSIKLEHFKSLKDLKVGDTVSVAFEETTEEDGSGRSMARKPTAIYFIRKATKDPFAITPEDLNEDILEPTQ